MAVEGLGKTYGIPAVKKEQDPGMYRKKKERRKQGGKKKEEEKNQKGKDGNIDIRV